MTQKIDVLLGEAPRAVSCELREAARPGKQQKLTGRTRAVQK